MYEILSLLQCLMFHVDRTTLRRMNIVVSALLAMSGRITMRGISRWSGDGGSYRTIQRFFNTVIPWPALMWEFFRTHGWCRRATYLLAGDEVVVTKSGKKTYGLGRFFSSLYDHPVPGLAFFCLSLVSVEQRRAYPVRLEQVIRTTKGKQPSSASPPTSAPKSTPPKRQRGRPKGSKNKVKTEVCLNRELRLVKGAILALFALMGGLLPIRYLLLDGHFGNNPALQMARQCHLHLISKLRHDSQLFVPYQSKDARRKYGERLNPKQLPVAYRVEATTEDGIRSERYQLRALSPAFGNPLNGVIICKTHLATQRQAHVILFSSDLELVHEQLVDYYALRFQIEFNFRDAKQFWGLEDFMNTTERGVTNAANLALFMVNVSQRLLQQVQRDWPDCSILDLKAGFRGYLYVKAVLKLLPQKLDPILSIPIFAKVTNLGAIHPFFDPEAYSDLA
ncbi:MAG: transposase [Cyanobacteria bacterium]|nr:transposase [Cyanobacteriota bacterium]MDA0866272.1 transposase [Cyanobacteriota bacterium]